MTFSSIEVKLTAKRINFWASVKPCDLYQYMWSVSVQPSESYLLFFIATKIENELDTVTDF